MPALIDSTVIDTLAGRLRAAYERYEPIAPIRDDLAAGGLDAAYTVQLCNADHWTRQRRRIVGRKSEGGLT